MKNNPSPLGSNNSLGSFAGRKISVQDVIQDALEWHANEDRRERQSIVDKLFDFSTYGSRYREKSNSAAMLHISERFMEEHEEARKWYYAAEVWRKLAMHYAEALSPMGGRDLEARAEEEIKKRLS